MENNELLLSISNLLDTKFQPLNNRMDSLEQKMDSLEQKVDSLENKVDKNYETLDFKIHKINLTLENVVVPRLQHIEQCYLDTSKRYIEETENIQKLRSDVDTMKSIIQSHSEQLRMIS